MSTLTNQVEVDGSEHNEQPLTLDSADALVAARARRLPVLQAAEGL